MPAGSAKSRPRPSPRNQLWAWGLESPGMAGSAATSGVCGPQRVTSDQTGRTARLTRMNDVPISRRALLLGTVGLVGCGVRGEGVTETRKQPASGDRMPTAFIPHGGGPWPVLELPMMPSAEGRELAAYMRSIADTPSKPRALLVVSA